MFRQAITAGIIIGLQTAPMYALPSHEEIADGGLRVMAPGHQVELSVSGAIRRCSGPTGAVLHSPSGGAWVLRSGQDGWVSAGEVFRSRTVTVEGESLLVTFEYEGDAAAGSYRCLLVYTFTDAPEFTVTGWIENVAGPTVELIAFPGPLIVDGVPLEEIVFPFQRGIITGPPRVGESLSTTIPAGFTDFLSFETANGVLAISELVGDAMPTDESKRIAVYRAQDAGNPLGWHADRTLELPPGNRWTSGTTLFQIGRTSAGASRRHWELGATGRYPKLSDKLSADLYGRLSRSVLFKYPDGFRYPFASAELARRLARLPNPSLLNIPGYMPGGHDSNYPDYLPPDAALGTTEQFRGLIDNLRTSGVLVAPYSNPTWWNADSPTMMSLGEAVAKRDPAGNPRTETYGEATGVVVDPANAGVRARHAQTAREFTEDMEVDLLFEDQVGARGWLEGPPGPGRFSYSAALLSNARTMSQSLPVMTEGGWDRLAEFEIGFCGNGRLAWERPNLPADRWRPWPMMQVMANAHTATYPHNLAGEVMAHNRAEMLHMVAFGSNLAYDLNRGPDPWLVPCATLQSRVLSRGFGREIMDFQDSRPADGTTLLIYANGDEVLGNWNDRPIAWRDHQVAREGFAWRNSDDTLLAGWFRSVQGTEFPPADRLIIRENGNLQILLEGDPGEEQTAGEGIGFH